MGALTFVCGLPARRFRVEDLGWAEELGRRAGLAIENARHYREAREALAARDEFLSVATHELRTPLTALKLQLQGLEGVLPKPREKRVTTKLDRAMRQTERFTELVETLLDVSRLTAGRLQLEREKTDLAEVVVEVAERFREQAERAHCDLVVHADGPVVGQWDRLRLDLIATNLLSNAIRYAPGKPIELRVENNATTATLSVRDNGPGIPEDQWSRIFNRFERAAGVRPFGGLGLGLYITRQSVEAHGGVIRISSPSDGGASFIVELPRQTTSEKQAS
jgi:signal transduction histidine kinase